MKTNQSTLKEAISDLLHAYKLDDKLDERKLISSWETLMGKMIAKHTKQIFIKDKILTVKLDSAVLREELSFAKTKMLKMLNEHIGREIVKEIVLR